MEKYWMLYFPNCHMIPNQTETLKPSAIPQLKRHCDRDIQLYYTESTAYWQILFHQPQSNRLVNFCVVNSQPLGLDVSGETNTEREKEKIQQENTLMELYTDVQV